ncbi:guided entry of tail-anchored proteins factor 1-like isoform X2 [Cylas formicarius]|nr:guided entry of tail-anchored proteins factor 1-like isoform X2 [Cylas formicarius]XP_060516965.1 guided entry of tail-anchored proteins factor 1-like isoform X2 [Cylas formicarius]
MAALLIISTILSFLTAYSDNLGKLILHWINKSSKHEKNLLNEKVQLKREQCNYNMMDDFAKYSKVQRKINKIEEELEHIENKKIGFVLSTFCIYSVKCLCTMCILALTVYFKGSYVFKLDDSIDLTPFNYLISYPNEKNFVSIHFWIMCCNVVASLIKHSSYC